jgi:hypothetical protein
LTSAAGLRDVAEAGQVGPAIDQRANDMRVRTSNRRLTKAKTRPNAYEIPGWAIADAIRRRTNKGKTTVLDEPEPLLPQRADDFPEATVPDAIASQRSAGRADACPPSL